MKESTMTLFSQVLKAPQIPVPVSVLTEQAAPRSSRDQDLLTQFSCLIGSQNT